MNSRCMVCILALVLLQWMGCHSTRATADGPARHSPANTMKTADEAAQKALAALPQLAQTNTYRGMGFASIEEARSAQLGAAIPRKIVSYVELLKYQPGVPLSRLFTGDEEMVYPFQIGSTTKSTTAVSKKEGAWHIASVGDAYLARVMSAAPEQPQRLHIISVPGLSLDFAGTPHGEDWELFPAQDYPELDVTRGRPIRAEELLPRLSNYAKNFEKQYGDQIRKRRLVK
ncbi:MAG TPA: hypothetical protein VFQ34_12545 [Nitrospiraceae bacterium]|nr:hypothetical protein [Nitrospiraceae bacterium]